MARWFDCGRKWVAAWLACGVLLAITAAAAQPSIVLILSDDEDVASHRVMEQTKALIEDQGTVLDNYFVTYSFCCPSRTTILRGQYPHNHRIEGNELARRRVRQVPGAGPRQLDRRDLAAAAPATARRFWAS